VTREEGCIVYCSSRFSLAQDTSLASAGGDPFGPSIDRDVCVLSPGSTKLLGMFNSGGRWLCGVAAATAVCVCAVGLWSGV
jgi:hypothetical protein